jgi:hypothetical protein
MGRVVSGVLSLLLAGAVFAAADDGFLCHPKAPATASLWDRQVHPEPPLPPLPAAGGTFVDPTFRTTIMRLTDEADGPNNQVGYSYWPTFNRDSTRAAVATGDGQTRTLYRLDPVSFTLLGKETVPFSPSGPLQWDDAIWSGTDPDAIFGHTFDGKLWRYDAAAQEFSLVKDFATEFPGEYQWQMSKSLDDNVFAFTRRQLDNFAILGYMVWRRDTDRVVMNESTVDLDEVQVDKTGRWLYIVTQQEGHGAIEGRIADLWRGQIVADLIDDAPDQAPGHHDSGRGTLIGAANWINAITFRKYATPHQFIVALDLGNDWSQALHTSMLAEDERWATVSFFGDGGDGLFHREIVQLATDGSQRVRRLAHHRSVFGQYYDAPRANASRDGCFVAFTSNWGGSGRWDVFILNLASSGGPAS